MINVGTSKVFCATKFLFSQLTTCFVFVNNHFLFIDRHPHHRKREYNSNVRNFFANSLQIPKEGFSANLSKKQVGVKDSILVVHMQSERIN